MQARDLLTAFLGAFLALVGMEVLKYAAHAILDAANDRMDRIELDRLNARLQKYLGDIREKKDS